MSKRVRPKRTRDGCESVLIGTKNQRKDALRIKCTDVPECREHCVNFDRGAGSLKPSFKCHENGTALFGGASKKLTKSRNLTCEVFNWRIQHVIQLLLKGLAL